MLSGWPIGCILVATVLLAGEVNSNDEVTKKLELLQQQLSENRSKLSEFEAQSEQLVELVQDNEKKRAELSSTMLSLDKSIKELSKQEHLLSSDITVLKKTIGKTTKLGKQASAWAMSLSRGGTIELLLNAQETQARMRQRGLLVTTLNNIEIFLDDAQRQKNNLEQKKLDLRQTQSNLLKQRKALRGAKDSHAARQKQLQQSLALIKSDARLTKKMIEDLELSQKNLSRVLSSSKRIRRSNVPLESLKQQLQQPVFGDLLMGYGTQKDPVFGVDIEHPGWTYSIKIGTPVIAIANAETVYAGWLRGYGNLIVLQHDENYFTLYGHLGEMFVQQGDGIKQGSPIGLSGDSGSLYGPALHFEIRRGKQPLDPDDWLSPQ